MNKEKAIKLASIVIGLLITIVIIWFGLRFVSRGRAVSLSPSDIKIENVTPTSFRVTYQTRSGLTPVVSYGQSPTTLNYLVPPSETTDIGNDQSKYQHDVTLLAGGTYYFVVKIGEEEFNNAGVPFSVQLTDEAGGTPTISVTPAITANATQEPTSTPAPTDVVATPTQAFKPLSQITDCSEMKDANGQLKDPYTGRDWAQCIKQHPK